MKQLSVPHLNKLQKKKEEKVDIYQLENLTNLLCLLEGVMLTLILSYLFYETLWAAIVLSPIIYVVYQRQTKKKKQQMKWKLNLEFKDALAGMTAAMSAGYSVENSIAEALTDLRCIYRDSELIVKEFQRMQQRIELNTTVEQVFFEFSERCEIDDVSNFAWILYTAKRTGGDLLKITRSTSNMISDRIEVSREIQTVIAAKKMESDIMSLVPAGIIVYLKLGCSGFLDSLYGNAAGICVMSMVLIGYFFAYLFAAKIVHIQL